MATQPAVETRPSERARLLVEGAYDLHVHVDPDVIPRRIDDRTLAGRFAEAGLAGFALKSHYTSTAERAQVVSALVPGVQVLGTLTLNRAVGGMNALAVEIAAREGARIVWMPTVDSPAETAGRTEPKPGDKEAVLTWKRRMASAEGKEIYRQRAATSETVNADLRSYRGLTQLTVRGLSKIKCAALWCALAYNVMHFGAWRCCPKRAASITTRCRRRRV